MDWWSKAAQISNIRSFLIALYLVAKPSLQRPFEWRIVMGKGVLVFLVIWMGFSLIAFYMSRQPSPRGWKTTQKVVVLNKTLQNEKVLLDGHSYSGCRFVNVTFIYNADAPFDLTNNTIEGSWSIETDNVQISGMIKLLNELKMLQPSTQVKDRAE